MALSCYVRWAELDAKPSQLAVIALALGFVQAQRFTASSEAFKVTLTTPTLYATEAAANGYPPLGP